MPDLVFASIQTFDWTTFLQYCLIGLTTGSLIALVALGYTMVYGIIELVNFAHGDLVMLGSFLALTLLGVLGLQEAGTAVALAGLAVMLVAAGVFCGALNWTVTWYRPAGPKSPRQIADALAAYLLRGLARC